MQLSRLIFSIVLLLTPICFIATTWLYLYPLFHGCAFPVPPPSSAIPPIAPFRLLALGDPQLEGDSSLPKAGASVFPSLRFLVVDLRRAQDWRERSEIINKAAKRLVVKDVPKWLKGKRKAVDLWGNDYYLAHIVRSLRWWTEPSHVAVLGDLLGSQWVSDGEFERRAERYWGRVFKGMERVPDAVMEGEDEDDDQNEDKDEDDNDQDEDKDKDKDQGKRRWGRSVEVLGADKNWKNRVINIAGNHDVGYAGDMSEARIERFERAFGKAHWDIAFEYPQRSGSEDESATTLPATLRLVILNTMNLDTPALSESLQQQTYDFMNHVIKTSRSVTDKTHATILLTHIPLHKESGICVDSPLFEFHSSGSGIREQNMLSEHASKIVLEGIYGLSGNPDAEGQGLGRKGVILNGHDHEGCDVVHYISQPRVSEKQLADIETAAKDVGNGTLDSSSAADIEDIAANTTIPANEADNESAPQSEPPPPQWYTHRYLSHTKSAPYLSNKTPQMREITLRSMMGDFSGYAGFLSAWFDPTAGEAGEWQLGFQTCGVGVQHWWWGVHVVDIVVAVLIILALVVRGAEGTLREAEKLRKQAKGERRAPETPTLAIKEGKTAAAGYARSIEQRSGRAEL